MKTINKAIQMATVTSTSHLSLQEQKVNLTSYYVQSSYNIAWLNESLPPFMSRQGSLAPFALAEMEGKLETSETWTAPTRYYSVDIDCEAPTDDEDGPVTSSWGCSYDVRNIDYFLDGIQDNQYNLAYVGYWFSRPYAHLNACHCPKQESSTFLIRSGHGWRHSANATNAPSPLKSSTLWCRPTYCMLHKPNVRYMRNKALTKFLPDQQDVNATVVPPRMSMMNIVPTGPKIPLPFDLVNITELSWSLSQGKEFNNNRGPFPTSSWPFPQAQLNARFPEMYFNSSFSEMAGFALGASQRPVADYLNPEVLKDSYQAAYRLLFARKLSDILMSDYKNGIQSSGVRHYSTQALIMVPTFVYVVEGLLAITVVAAFIVLVAPSWRRTVLTSEPANLAAMMALAANDTHLVQTMRDKDLTTSDQLETLYQQTTFKLQEGHQGPTLCCMNPPATATAARCLSPQKYSLPMELSWCFGTAFLSLQCLTVGALVSTYICANLNNGKYNSRYQLTHADCYRLVSAFDIPAHKPDSGEVFADGRWCLLRTSIHMAYKNTLYAAAFRRTSKRRHGSFSGDHGGLRLTTTSSSHIQSLEDRNFFACVGLLHHDPTGQSAFCSLQQHPPRARHSGIYVAELHIRVQPSLERL